MQTVFSVANSIVTIYMLLLFIRILLSWFGGIQSMGRPAEILSSITDPYLNLFRGIPFLRFGYLDFSPIMAIIVLSVLSSVLHQLSFQQQVTVGLLLSVVVTMLLSAISFFSFIFMALAVIRLVGIWANLGTGGPFMSILDMIFQPLSFRMAAKLFSGRSVSYTTTLQVIILLCAAVSLGSWYYGPVLSDLLKGLPF